MFDGGTNCGKGEQPWQLYMVRRTIGGVMFASAGPLAARTTYGMTSFLHIVLLIGFHYWFSLAQYSRRMLNFTGVEYGLTYLRTWAHRKLLCNIKTHGHVSAAKRDTRLTVCYLQEAESC